MTKKVMEVCETLEQVSHATGTVSYIPRGEPGGWEGLCEYLKQMGVTSFDEWSVTDFLRAVVGYLFAGQRTPAFVCSQYFDSADDDTPRYRIALFDIGYAQLDLLDTKVQRSWFDMYIDPKGSTYTVALEPKRSLMKLIYKNLV